MKICIWISSIFQLGGTKQVVTLLANELSGEHDVTIMTYDKRQDENRNLYGLSRRVHIDYVDPAVFRKTDVCHRLSRKLLVAVGDRTPLLNHRIFTGIQRVAYYPSGECRRWCAYLNKKGYDVIIATAESALKLAVLSRNLNAHTIGWAHNCYQAYTTERYQLFWHREALLRRYLPQLDRMLVLNQYDKKEYDSHLNMETCVMPNPRSFVSSRKSDCSSHCFFAAVRLVPQKGIDLMLRAFAQFCEMTQEDPAMSDWKLVIAGSGALEGELKELSRRLGIDERVHFSGLVENVQEYYLNAGAYLMTSRWEGWGLVVIEAFEMGLPVIAFDITPLDLLITHGKDGYIIPGFHIKTYAKAMVRLANDEKLRQRMGKAAAKKAEQFSMEAIGGYWRKLLDEVMIK